MFNGQLSLPKSTSIGTNFPNSSTTIKTTGDSQKIALKPSLA